MSYDQQDADYEAGMAYMYGEVGPQWAEDHAQELIEKYYDEVVEHFTSERLTSYYLDNREVASKAFAALAYAQSLLISYPRAAIVFAATSIEVTVKTVLLRPIVSGFVHSESMADLISELTTKHTGGIDTFNTLLTAILSRFIGHDLKTYKRNGSNEGIHAEIKRIQDARNAIIHRADSSLDSEAPVAVAVASTLLNDILPRLLDKLGLRLDAQMRTAYKRS
jgi:hypothetical protein